jgi:multidrug efflux pump subunit AcrB
MFSHIFIDRPIFAMVVSLVVVIAGGAAMFNLPVAQYPDMTPVQIQVTATYPGADAQTVAQNIGAPIEQQVNGADHMIYMQSTSSSTGNYTLNVYFEQGTAPQIAQVDVQNRVQWATPQLPSAVTAQGVIVKKTTASFMLVIALYSPDGRYDPDYIANYTNINVLDAIKRIDGANQASILGVPDYAMRIWLRPDRMAQLDITATDVANAVRQQNQQFAVTIAISVAFSGLVALTLSPALAAILLKPGHGEKHGFFRWFENTLERVTNAYVAGTRWIMHHTLLAFGAFGAVVVAAGWLFSVWPTAFVPEEDQGYLFVPYFLPDAASLDRTQAVGEQAAAFLMNHPAVENVTEFDGYSLIDQQNKTNRGLLFVSLKDFEERKAADLSAPAVIRAATRDFADIKEGIVLPLNPPAIPGLGVTAGFEMWIQQRGSGDYAQLVDHVQRIIAKAQQNPELARVSATVSAENRQLLADLDRDKSEILQVPVSDVYDTLQTLFGSLYVNQFPKNSRLWQVILQAEPAYRLTPGDIDHIYVRSKSGSMIPLSALVSTHWATGPDLVTRFNNYPAAPRPA